MTPVILPKINRSPMAKANNLNITTEGSGTVISQSIMVDTAVEEGTIIKLTLSTESDGTNQ